MTTQLETEVRSQGGAPAGQVEIGFPPSVGSLLIGSLLAKSVVRYPSFNRSLSLLGMIVLCFGMALSSASATSTANQEIQTAPNKQLCVQATSGPQECRAATTAETAAKKMRPIMFAGNQAACSAGL